MHEIQPRPHVQIRGIYGGVPTQLFDQGKTLNDYGVNAIWIGSGGLKAEDITVLKQQGAKVYAEFNSLHEAGYLKEHPDAAPIGIDGNVCPPPDGWQGICPTHPGYRIYRMATFRTVLKEFDIDGIWLDYHHSHASWEQAEPNMPDTCFCDRCLAQFQRDTKISLPDTSTAEKSKLLLETHKQQWVAWRCAVFTDWVREFREIVNEVRPQALLGTFHCPWSDTDNNHALRDKLAIDLKAQAKYIDVFSIMPYHARFGHVNDPEWIFRQTHWLGHKLRLQDAPGECPEIWPIVQLSDWGEQVVVEQVQQALDYGTRLPATGVMVFAWGSLHTQPDKIEEMGAFYRAIRP